MSSALSRTKSTINGHLFLQESSFASNQLQAVPSSHNPSFDAPTIAANENREKLYHQDLPASFNKNFTLMSMPNSETFSTSFPVRKHAPRSESEIDDGHSETGVVSRESRAELDSSNAPDISCRSTTLDGISLEATSFCQLQQVMEQVVVFYMLFTSYNSVPCLCGWKKSFACIVVLRPSCN